jgi:hypothetical protein
MLVTPFGPLIVGEPSAAKGQKDIKESAKTHQAPRQGGAFVG